MTDESEHTIQGSYTRHMRQTHARAVVETQRKIQKIFHLKEFQAHLAPSMQDKLTLSFDNDLQKEEWTKRRDSWSNDMSPEEAQILDTTAKKMMLRYVQAFFLREEVKDTAHNHAKLEWPETFYRRYPHQWDLLDTHITHMVNDTQAQLEELTHGNIADAFKMHSYMINQAIFYSNAFAITRNATLEPGCKDLKEDPEECIRRIKQYGQDAATNLRRDFKKFHGMHKEIIADERTDTRNNPPSIG